MREEYLKRLEREILLDFYEKNDNSRIEVLTDYERVYARYIDRKTYLWEGEAIDDGFVDMKTTIYLNETLQEFERMNLKEDEIISFNELHIILNSDFQKLIDMNKERGIDIKITVCGFEFPQHSSFRIKDNYVFKSLLTTYKIERIQ